MKNLQLLLLCLFANIVFGQTKFDNEKLMAVQNIFFNSTKDNISSFMKDKGYTVVDVEPGDEEYGDAYNFKSEYNRVQIQYTPKGITSGVVMLYAGAINNTFIEMAIRDAGYTFVEHANVIEGVNFKRKQWSKKGEKTSFVTYADDKEKIGFLGFGEFED
ncbi:hypothetical protein QFZ37_001001 [Chryseobacterium ginsenosidimutans]|uniref:hypothetical protein n=1 Tax=Chryseobacterium ginsenosidimutans TaxID=687846 RepID=UPI00277D794E|nr:hypothetical protein [Chryseobacterium ginsenosidimutans]MDQ0592632.1 hypothetical protein [Chryseobacterium ginsenosidimutans]